MELKITDNFLTYISGDYKLDEVKGIVLHSNPEFFNKTIDEVHKELQANNTESNQNVGCHYLIEGETIYRLIDEKFASRILQEDKPTYIAKSLFGDTINQQNISIGIIVNENTDYEITEKTLIHFLVYLMRKYSINPLDIWRGFDLDKTNVGPYHMLSKVIFEKYINELAKFVPIPEGAGDIPADMDDDTEIDTNTINSYNKRETIEIEKGDEAIEIVSPFKEDAEKDKCSITQYVSILYQNNINDIEAYVSKYQPWDKDRDDARTVTTIEGDLQTKQTPYGNTLQYKISEEAALNTDHCVQPVDFLQAVETSEETMVEPIYPDLITPPGDNIHIADGFCETAVQSDNNTPLTSEELEKRQKTFDFTQFSNMKKITKGRPVNVEDAFPVDDQIKKLEEHYPKVKIDKITYDFKDTNHPNSEIGNAMAKNYAMCYDMVTEIAKRTEQRLVKLENNLATVMRNLFRMSSRVNINCVYYGGQSVYGKYKCIRCLHDDRINDGAIVTIDQCMNCTRYEPILGQVYAILDETGSNIVQVMDDLQMSYMELEDYKNLNSVSNYHEEIPNAKVDQHSQDKPKPFIEDKWKDTEEEQKIKKEKLEAIENTNKENNEQDSIEQDKTEKPTGDNVEDKNTEDKEEVVIPNGFKMDWTPVKLEIQEPHINTYEEEKLKAEKKALSSETEGIDREIYEDSRGQAVESEQLEFNIADYEFGEFGNASSGIYNMGAGYDSQAREKIMQYVKDAIQLCSEGKAKYSQDYRYNHLDKALDGIHYWDCSSLVQKAYEAAGISGIGTNTKTIFPYCLDKEGGLLIPIANESEAIPGDIIWFTNQNPKPNGSREELQKTNISLIPHVGIYMGDGKYGHSSYAHSDSTKDIVIAEISSNKKSFCFARPKALIEMDSQFGQGLTGNSHWSRKYHGITDEWWNKASVVDGQVQLFVKNMDKWGYKEAMIQISQQKGFDPYLTAAIITVESTGDPRDNDKYAGLMQVQGHYGTTELAGMKDNISKGIDMILKKKTYLKQKGWQEDNIHVLVSAYNSGEGTVGKGATKYNVNLATCKIPELGDALYKYVKSNNPGWNAVEKQTYAVKVLRAYNLIYSNNYLGLPQENTQSYDTYDKDFLRPLDKKYKINSPFGPRTHPITGKPKTPHKGVDMAAPRGVSIKATKAGKVIKACYLSGYGNAVYLDHGNGITSRYAHMSSITVKNGQTVKQGDEVGKVGTTGASTGNHLHFEIRINGEAVDPQKYI